LWFSFVAFQVTALTYGELNGSIKWHPPFISVGNGAGEADLIAAVALPGEGGCGLLPKVKLERAARLLPFNGGSQINVGLEHV
jgi:hypothetical protein